MKIAFVIDTMKYGGIERISINYLKLLIEMNHTIDVYILNKKVDPIIEEIPSTCKIKTIKFSKYLCPETYWVIAKRYKLGKLIFPFIYLLLRFLTPLFRLFKGSYRKYDLAIAFSGHYNDLTYTLDYIKAKKRLCWLHGTLAEYLLLSPGFGMLYNRFKNIVVLSEEDQEIALHNNPWLNLKIYKLYNPIDIAVREINQDKVNHLKEMYGDFIVMVSRMQKDKDHITVVKAIKLLNDQFNLSVNLVLVGDGELRPKIEELVQKFNLENQVVFEGARMDVQNYYESASLFVHSSPFEGLPTVILEALTFGLPVVATDSKFGVKEILGDSKYGKIVPVYDEVQMAEAIVEMISQPQLYENYRTKGFERIQAFKPELIKQKLEEVLGEVISETRKN
jgi:glycosyltransferase involved in cell wall biosynthesis